MSHPSNPYIPLNDALERLRAERARFDAEQAAERAARTAVNNLYPRRSDYRPLEEVAARQIAAKEAQAAAERAAAEQAARTLVQADHGRLHAAIQGQQQQKEAVQLSQAQAAQLAQEQAAQAGTLDRIARAAQRIRDTERTSRQPTELMQLTLREQREREVEGERLRRFEPNNREKIERHEAFTDKAADAVLNPDRYMQKEQAQEPARREQPAPSFMRDARETHRLAYGPGQAPGQDRVVQPSPPQSAAPIRDHVVAETRRAVQHQESDLVARHELRVLDHNRGVQVAQAAARQSATPVDERRAALRQRYSAGQEVTERMKARAGRQTERTDRQQVTSEQQARRQALRERYASQPAQGRDQGRDR